MQPIRLMLATALLALSPTPGLRAQSAECPVDDPLCFAVTAIWSLQTAHASALGARSDTTGGVQAASISALYSLRVRRRGVSRAHSLIAPFAESHNANIRLSASAFLSSYRLYTKVDSLTGAAITRALDHPEELHAGQVADAVAALAEQRQQSAEGLVVAVGELCQAFLFMGPKDERVTALTLTRAQRDVLLEQLQEAFGRHLEPREGVYSSDFAMAASALREFLLDKWQFAGDARL